MPERLADWLPRPLVELTAGIFVAVVVLLLRMGLTPVAGDRAPYAFVFVSVVVASVVAGWRSGVVALLVGQLMTWYFLVDAHINLPPTPNDRLGGLIIATVAQLIMLVIIMLYQREVEKGVYERDRRMELLDHARREIDHRAKNNFQTVLSLVQLQSSREEDPKVQQALNQVADRITAISVATEQLAMRSEGLTMVRLRDHLCDLCAQLERGLARGDIRVECNVSDVTASADTAVQLAIIVNELVTNALKHAFFDGRTGLVRVSSQTVDGGLEIEVSDNGCGMKTKSPSAGTGLGRKLVETFVRHLDAKHDVSSSSSGTTHRIIVPVLA